MKFEKKQFARFKSAKARRRRRPEINFSQMRFGTQVIEPVPIGHRDNQPYGHLSSPSASIVTCALELVQSTDEEVEVRDKAAMANDGKAQPGAMARGRELARKARRLAKRGAPRLGI
jgi:hypothetical protein